MSFTLCHFLFAHHSVSVGIAHVPIGGVPAAHRRDAAARASAQEILLVPLLSHRARASTSVLCMGVGRAVGVEAPGTSTTISVD